jgi:polysaccharide export outer membrane protein
MISFPEQETAPMPEPVIAGLSEEERLSRLEEIRNEPPAAFVLGRGDVIGISVYDEPDLAAAAIPVRPDGMISFALIGDVSALNRTVEELRADVTERLSRFIKQPRVSVVVSRFMSQQYTIAGEVEKPGVFSIETDLTLSQVLARSGGLRQGQFKASSVELADLSHAFLSRDGETLPIDFVALFKRGDMRYDVSVMPGDYIYIPSGLSQEIYVLGEVNHPDMFAFTAGMPLTKALVVAKGFSRDADICRVHLVRGSLSSPEVYTLDLNQIFEGRIKDVALKPGDIVFVPPTGLTRWSDAINKIIPAVVLANSGTNLLNRNFD